MSLFLHAPDVPGDMFCWSRHFHLFRLFVGSALVVAVKMNFWWRLCWWCGRLFFRSTSEKRKTFFSFKECATVFLFTFPELLRSDGGLGLLLMDSNEQGEERDEEEVKEWRFTTDDDNNNKSWLAPVPNVVRDRTPSRPKMASLFPFFLNDRRDRKPPPKNRENGRMECLCRRWK